MSVAKVALGWEVGLAYHYVTPYAPLGGRIFSMASIPFGLQDFYMDYHGATRKAQMQAFIVDIVRWLRGGRSFGTVACSPIGDAIDYSWYRDGENETLVGSYARSALTSAGFTVIDYGPQKTADNYFNGADVVIFDQWSNDYDTGDPQDQIEASESAPIWDYVVNQDRAMLYLCNANSGTGFGFNAAYAYGVGAFQLYGYAGAEALFENALGGGKYLGTAQWGGAMSVSAGINNTPAHGLTYPSTKLAGWRNATMTPNRMVFSAFSNHEDIGDTGDPWVL